MRSTTRYKPAVSSAPARRPAVSGTVSARPHVERLHLGVPALDAEGAVNAEATATGRPATPMPQDGRRVVEGAEQQFGPDRDGNSPRGSGGLEDQFATTISRSSPRERVWRTASRPAEQQFEPAWRTTTSSWRSPNQGPVVVEHGVGVGHVRRGIDLGMVRVDGQPGVPVVKPAVRRAVPLHRGTGIVPPFRRKLSECHLGGQAGQGGDRVVVQRLDVVVLVDGGEAGIGQPSSSPW